MAAIQEPYEISVWEDTFKPSVVGWFYLVASAQIKEIIPKEGITFTFEYWRQENQTPENKNKAATFIKTLYKDGWEHRGFGYNHALRLAIPNNDWDSSYNYTFIK